MYSHSKRMLPRKDEPFRAEFPNQYYSSSSVYSYTPTSSSDCPEHGGRSYRRMTIILTTCVILVTLGVLGIAGFSAHLDSHSKGSKNASQSEESFMLLNSNSKILSSEDEGEIFYGNGRSSHRDPSVDLTNSLLETRPDSPGSPNFEDIDSDLIQKQPVPVTKVRFSQRNSTSVVTSKVNVNAPTSHYEETPNNNKNNHGSDIIRTEPIIVQTSTTTVQNQQSNSQSQSQQQYPLRYSPLQKDGSPPPLVRYPPTNSHYADHINNENQQSHFLTDFDSESSSMQRNPVVTSGILNFHDFHEQRTSNEATSANVKHKIAHPNPPNNTVTDAESKVTRKEGQERYKPTSTTTMQMQRNDSNVDVENGQGLAGSASSYENIKKLSNTNKHNSNPISGSGVSSKNNNKNEGNESYRWTTTMRTPTRHHTEINNAKQKTTSPSTIRVQGAIGGSGSNPDQFVPVNPFFKTWAATPTSVSKDSVATGESEGAGSGTANKDLLANHRVHLTFDRISPEHYDQNAWTPLVVRPTLDKKPRVESDTDFKATQSPDQLTAGVSTPILIPAQSKEMLYRYGDKTSNVNVNFRDPDPNYGQGSLGYDGIPALAEEVDGIGDNGALRHGPLESEHNRETIKQNDSVNPDKGPNMSVIVSTSVHQSTQDGVKMPPSMPSLSHSSSGPDVLEESVGHQEDEFADEEDEETWDENLDADFVQPAPFPAYTVIIPHIPNPKPKSDEIQHDETNRVANPNLTYDVNRMGEVDDDQFLPANETGNGESTAPANDLPHNIKNEEVEEDQEAKIGELILPDSIDLKDDEYTDNDDVPVETSPQTKIYKLDSENIDLLPNSNDKLDHPDRIHIQNAITNSTSSSEESPIKGPVEPDLQMRTTTDFILSTLGNLNLVKPLTSKADNENVSPDSNNGDSKTEPPLFPPIRSYVGINQPLRPKPSESEESEEARIILLSEPNFIMNGDPHRKLRVEDENGVPQLTPDITTTSSFNKVLSMMMKFDADAAAGLNRTGNSLANITTQNIHLVVAHTNYSAPIAAYLNDSNREREQKSIHRDAKIDSRFRDLTEQIPVALISAGPSPFPSSSFRPGKSNSTGKWNPNKLSSVTVTNSNSPVYKFVLRKGQSVEELLKEIFHNYTNKGIGIGNSSNNAIKGLLPPSANIITTRPEVPGSSPGSVDIQFTTQTTTTNIPIPSPSSTTTSTMPPPPPVVTAATTTTVTEASTDQEINTSTSVVLNSDDENEYCGTNSSFRCTSTGTCVSSFARCNGIRDCPDNSDEKGCLCVDFLKSQMLHRKICDGIPDCKDFSDEYQCEWCTPGQYICAQSRACIPRDKICDGKRDCPRGDDEGDCVKIGHTGEVDELEDLSPTYHRSGHLMVRKKGVWGKLCVETFSTVLSHWEVKDLARAVCKAKTFSDFETVERVEDEEFNASEPYYELFDGISQNDSAEASYPSSESAPRSSIGFKLSPCKTKIVVKVTCQDLQCGTAPRAFTQAARIVGGSNALAGEWPWQAALYRDGEYQCGATLISSRWLLSAGHCFYHSQDDHWVARLGTLRRGATILSPYEQVIRVSHVFLHPQYKDVGFINDVSLLRLENEVNFTDFVRPVCLPDKNTQIKDGRMCTVVGWGQLFEVGRVFPDTLQEVQLPLISTTECRKRTLFLPLYKLTDEMFCAGFDRGGRDACLGDSGGPLMCPESDGRWSLYGVTSNGYGCARANRPGVYTKVASYLDWIYDKMNKHSSSSYRDKAKPCRGHRCPLGECLEQRRLCNGFADCLDASDERNCTWS